MTQPDFLAPYLDGIVSNWQYQPVTGSTNADALQWADGGAHDFSLVLADQQTAGRGRMQRQWFTQPGAALAFSLILHPTPPEIENIGNFTALPALALVQALQNQFALNAQIKWSNDVLIDQKKVAGVLVEAIWQQQQVKAVIVGMGVNIRADAIPPANQLRQPATCIEAALNQPVDRWLLLRQILMEIRNLRRLLASPAFIALWNQVLAFRLQTVQASLLDGKHLCGVVEQVDAQGHLVLRLDDGSLRHLTAAEIERFNKVGIDG